MKSIKKYVALLAFTTISLATFAQDDSPQQSNIQQYTPSKLIGKGQWDLKWFNNLYTETEDTFTGDIPRNTFFTSTLEVYTGVGQNKRWNVGAIFEFRSNVVGGRGALEVFQFDGEEGSARSGFTSIAPSVKFVPIASVSNFSIQSSFFIPLVDNEVENGVFLDQNGFIWQNRLFYDYTFPGNKWQIFSEINSELNFGDADKSFANNSLRLTPGVFLSYFPSSKFTVLVLAQHSQLLDLGSDFSQDFTALGGGAKYQLTDALNVELLYTNFVRGSDTGLGETFNIGLRAIF
ncbi:hypothetical protein [Ulvibacterium marinum]|uniref:Transporter n=1 Tax=Ulvibacterium marinum TaxID=2419782 RepID=A0A3B0CBB0_9FLAO|nr:hypothetical protein [Ulvibacterium marinum]RKN83302.1 hypothetical protein D7Z94_05595 [Ulvibacterium marinum]